MIICNFLNIRLGIVIKIYPQGQSLIFVNFYLFLKIKKRLLIVKLINLNKKNFSEVSHNLKFIYNGFMTNMLNRNLFYDHYQFF